jgi:acetyltransferase EpsM
MSPNRMSDLFLIWGAGRHGKVVLDVVRSTALQKPIAFLDHDLMRAGLLYCDCPVIGGSAELHRFTGSSFIIAVGDNRTRAQCFNTACGSGLLPAKLVHSAATISPSAIIGPGTVVMPGVVVNAGAVIGQNCIINTGAIVEHDCHIADHVHISPRVALGGGVTVSPYAHVGIGAVVLPGATVGEESTVGAGAVVLRAVPARSTVVGVPAKPLIDA